MGIEVCADAKTLRSALAQIEEAENAGFMHCLAVLQITHAGQMVSDCIVAHTPRSGLIVRGHPTDANQNWGRYPHIIEDYVYKDGKIEEINQVTQREIDNENDNAK